MATTAAATATSTTSAPRWPDALHVLRGSGFPDDPLWAVEVSTYIVPVDVLPESHAPVAGAWCVALKPRGPPHEMPAWQALRATVPIVREARWLWLLRCTVAEAARSEQSESFMFVDHNMPVPASGSGTAKVDFCNKRVPLPTSQRVPESVDHVACLGCPRSTFLASSSRSPRWSTCGLFVEGVCRAKS